MTQAPQGIFAKPQTKEAQQRKPDVPAGTSPDLERLLRLEHTIRGASPASLAELPALEAAVKRADAIESIKAALTDEVMRRFYPLMNTALGFRTDRPNKKFDAPYAIEQVRVCMVEALLIGLRLTDNEWNIISDRCYVTREGFTRLLREHPGLTDLKINAGIPRGEPSRGVVIPYSCSWRLNGQEQTLVADIPVRGGEYATVDQLLGKGDRKIKARIWAKITGSEVSADGEVEIESDGGQKADQAQDRLAALKQAPDAKADQKPDAPKAKEPEPNGRVSGDANAKPPADWKPSEPEKAKPGEPAAPWEQ